MLITKIRDSKGNKLTQDRLNKLNTAINLAIHRAGFITMTTVKNGSSINISNFGCSFIVNTDILGYNARINRTTIKSCKTGYKRTSTPTWTQREEFNHLINNVLDKFKIKANIKSGDYVVRHFEFGRVNEWYMPEVYGTSYGLMVPSVLEIVPLKYASDGVQWCGVSAPFIGAVPETKPRFLK